MTHKSKFCSYLELLAGRSQLAPDGLSGKLRGRGQCGHRPFGSIWLREEAGQSPACPNHIWAAWEHSMLPLVPTTQFWSLSENLLPSTPVREWWSSYLISREKMWRNVLWSRIGRMSSAFFTYRGLNEITIFDDVLESFWWVLKFQVYWVLAVWPWADG
jgi:hypothetical protein